MVTALIFAGGIGERMNSKAKPKQFLQIHGKPILIYTLEHFEFHSEVDNIIVVCLESWIPHLKELLERHCIKKVKWIVAGGDTGHDSIYNGLKELSTVCKEDDIVIIHDGVRPLISEEIISENIRIAREKGNVVTVSPATESVALVKNEEITGIPNRRELYLVRAPQTFQFHEIWTVHQQAYEDNYKSVDSAGLMMQYGKKVHVVEGNPYNIKITSPSDYYIFRSIYDAQENLQVFGL